MISRRDVPVRADLRRQAENNLDVVRIAENLRLFSRERKWKLRWNGREKAQEAQKHELGLSAALTHAETEPPHPAQRLWFLRFLRFFAACSTPASEVEQVQRVPFATRIGRPGHQIGIVSASRRRFSSSGFPGSSLKPRNRHAAGSSFCIARHCR